MEYKKRILFIFVFISVNIYPQPILTDSIKQVTFFDYDVRHPTSFNADGYYFGGNSILLEAYSDSSINIEQLYYNASKDTFENLIKISNDDNLNINPLGIHFYGENEIVFFQTNIAGNWDIAYREFINGEWGTINYLFDSTGNETNPSLIKFGSNLDSVRILFEKDSSIFLLTKKDTNISKEIIFEKTDSLYYEQPTGSYDLKYEDIWIPVIYCAAIEKNINGDSKLVILYWKFNGEKSPKTILVDSGNVTNPRFLTLYYPTLSFENNIDGFNNIYFLDDFSNNGTIEKLIDDPSGDIFSFSSSELPPIVTKSSATKARGREIFGPFTFRLFRSDSSFTRVRKYNELWNNLDTLIYTKLGDFKPIVFNAGFDGNMQIYYYMWEDSINDRIGLKGKKEIYIFSDVNDKKNDKSFYLSQNYPNPFNPSTKIDFIISKTSFVTLKIFDVLGREVETLINESKPIGKYQVEFDGTNLSSGIYFYRLKAGSFIQSKKMILLR